MSLIVVCLDCPLYQKGGYCTHKRKDVSALAPACDHAKKMNQTFNPEDNDEPMKTPLAPQAQTKTCTKCGRELPISEFYARAGAKDGLQTICKDCHNAATKRCHDKAKAQAHIEKSLQEACDMKRCSKCGETKPLSDFYKDKKASDGHQSWCKHCAHVDNAQRARKALAEKRAKAQEQPKPTVVRETLTDKQMVDLLREHGWTVTCYRTITEEL